MANYLIDSLAFNNNTNVFTLPYGTCSTTAATAAKTVTVPNFTLDTGARVAIKFTNTNTAASPTLNVNSTTAKNIMYKGVTVKSGDIIADQVYEFLYDGTSWNLINTVDVYTKAESDALFAANDAMLFKGTIGTSGTVTALPTTYDAGWTYKVITAGTYAGKVCEVGDLIIAIKDCYNAASGATTDWTVVQTNIDGAVTGPTSAVDAHVAVFNGASGKIIKDSGYTIGCSVPADAKFTDTVTIVDDALSDASENAVQNKVIAQEFKKYLPLTGGMMQGDIDFELENTIHFNDRSGITFVHDGYIDFMGRFVLKTEPIDCAPTDNYSRYNESGMKWIDEDALEQTTYISTLEDEDGSSGFYLMNNLIEPCRLANIKDPYYDHDAANKKYVDEQITAKFEEYGIIHQHTFVATAGQTDFIIPYNYATSELLMIYYNGLLLTNIINYTVSGQTVTFSGWSANAGDYITAVSLAASAVTSTMSGNDYAEYRIANTLEAGRCVVETGDDDLIQSTERLQPGANIISDTYGALIGDESGKTPIAVAGRVLAYPLEDRELYRKAPGMPVCSGPNGTVSLMSREEAREYPECIVGYVSAVPKYEIWGDKNVKVNGRVWIKVK